MDQLPELTDDPQIAWAIGKRQRIGVLLKVC